MNQRKVSWQRNIRKVPSIIREKLRSLVGSPIRVGVTLSIPRSVIERGDFQHLGITLVDNEIAIAESTAIPPADMGRWSRTNVEGYEEVRKDLPMTTKSYPVDVPNWGDWSKGSHTIWWDRKVYQRDFIPPKETAIQIEFLARDSAKDEYVLLFCTEEVLSQEAPSFERDLFYNLNLLQENVGHVDVFQADASREDYLSTLNVSWEILPPGQRDENIAVIIGSARDISPEVCTKLVERYAFLEAMNPRNFIAGTSGFRRYFGAQFADNLVVFENVDYGNAAYVMGESWETLSQMSRTELLAMSERDFERVLHVGDWQKKLRSMIAERLLPTAA